LPDEHNTGLVRAVIRVEHNSFTGSLLGVVPVVYGYYLQRVPGGSITGPAEWRILSGADGEGVPDTRKARATLGNSRGEEAFVEFDVNAAIPFEEADEKFVGAAIVLAPIGPRNRTVPLEPSSSFSVPPPRP
jgi:hypothetical protein